MGLGLEPVPVPRQLLEACMWAQQDIKASEVLLQALAP